MTLRTRAGKHRVAAVHLNGWSRSAADYGIRLKAASNLSILRTSGSGAGVASPYEGGPSRSEVPRYVRRDRGAGGGLSLWCRRRRTVVRVAAKYPNERA